MQRAALAPAPDLQARVVILGGPSGCGKSTAGRLLAQRAQAAFYEGDDFHTPGNVAKLRAGQPLTDEDRRPWLLELAALADRHARGTAPGRAVIACSALKRAHRRILRGPHPASRVAIVMLVPSRQALERRVLVRAAQHAHFMPPSLLADQLATLELPPTANDFFFCISGDLPPEDVVTSVLALLASPHEGGKP